MVQEGIEPPRPVRPCPPGLAPDLQAKQLLARVRQTTFRSGLELRVIQKAVEVLELLPAQLQLLSPQASHGTH